MVLFKKITDLCKYLDDQRQKDTLIGFVPTMGALHEGHISLVNASSKANGITVCSIFVNPAQFNDPKDFEKYPITIERDIEMLEGADCNVLFLPSVNEMYPEPQSAIPPYNLGYLETILEGKYRPGHFQGVCKVVHRLLEIVKPDNLYLGQKDYQQCMVITRLVELMGQAEKIRIKICPTLREEDGLAMSSRNMRLNETERKQAAEISRGLLLIKEGLKAGSLQRLKQNAADLLVKNGFRPDYVEIADAGNLQPVETWDGKIRLVALAAAYLNDVRLIDNMIIS